MTAVGTELPLWDLPVTPTLVVSTALATRDFQDVHHDRDLAVERGSKDIFLNILTTTGLVQRYVGEWARTAIGSGFVVRSCGLRLGAPAYPSDTVRFTGTVAAVEDGRVTIDVVGAVVSTSSTDGMVSTSSTDGMVSTSSTDGGSTDGGSTGGMHHVDARVVLS